MTLSFFVHGTPKPQGSTQAMLSKKGKIYTKSGTPTLAAWRNVVVDAAISAMDEQSWEQAISDEPVSVTLEFNFKRPKSHTKKRRETDRYLHWNRPDLDKLIRAVIDGCTVAGLWHDDSQVAGIVASKRYANERAPHEGVRVAVARML